MKYLKIGHNHWENDAYTKHICGPWYLGPYYTCLFTNTKQCNKYGGIFKSFLDKFSSPCQSEIFPKLLATPKYVKGAPFLWPLYGGKTSMGKHLDSLPPTPPLKKKKKLSKGFLKCRYPSLESNHRVIIQVVCLYVWNIKKCVRILNSLDIIDLHPVMYMLKCL